MTEAANAGGGQIGNRRPDLGRRALLTTLALAALGVLLALVSGFVASPDLRRPGIPLRQGAALLGSLLLLVPLLFAVVKRGGLTASPPAWFVAHVLSSALGIVLIFFHASGGDWWSPPVLLLAALLFLVGQGVFARAYLSEDLASRFAAQTQSFLRVDPARQAKLRDLIRRKTELLTRLDPAASEALFSPDLRHALRHPILTFRYARLAGEEARLVGSRTRAGARLALWRRLHIAVACLFLIGMAGHATLATFFAGYVAGGREIYWWHITAWGAGW